VVVLFAFTEDLRAAPSGRGLVHRALPYRSEDELLSSIEPFAREGLDGDEAVVAIGTPRQLALLHQALGDRGGAVEAVDGGSWFRRPMRALASLDRLVRDHRSRAGVRVIEEIPWPPPSSPAIAEWTRYEAVKNVALAALPVSSLCLYDAKALAPDVVDAAARTHPEMLAGGEARASAAYETPEDLCRGLDAEPLSAPPVDAESIPIRSNDTLPVARRLVEAVAAAGGMARQRAIEAAFAANEIVTNALRHGGGRGELRCWIDADELVVRVDDRGSGIDDPLAGCIPPVADRSGGFGLWLVRQVAERVAIRSSEHGGATVQLWFAEA
jgi:anti-sigma regulatory factor (Ser/Thr protein kinase)